MPRPARAPGPTREERQAAARAAAKARTKLAEDLDRLCADAGLSFATLARSAGITHSFLDRIRAGKAAPSIETNAKLAVPLGADLATRLYPNTGPLVKDRHQAPILEALLRELHPRWRPHTELLVWRPERGAIDCVLVEQREGVLVATEIESEIRRIEQQIRWAKMKADSLPSWDRWPSDGTTRVSQLLIVRRTRATRHTAREFERQLAVAYPAHPEDALAALTGTSPWPGSVMIWAEIKPDRVRFLPTR